MVGEQAWEHSSTRQERDAGFLSPLRARPVTYPQRLPIRNGQRGGGSV